MDNKRLPVSLGNFSVVDSQLSRMRQRFSDEMLRMDYEMDRLMSGIEINDKMEQLCGEDSALITDHQGQKALKLTFDVSPYRPEEVTVETKNQKIIVRAKHEEKSKNKNIFMEYHRELSLPSDTDPESINISISDDGVLIATVPYSGCHLTSATKPALKN